MIPEPKEVLKLAAEIETAEKVLADLREQWKAIFSGVGITPTKQAKASHSPQNGSVRDYEFSRKVIEVLEKNPTRHFSIADVAEATNETDQLKVGRTLNRLSFRKKIESRGRGFYGGNRNMETAA